MDCCQKSFLAAAEAQIEHNPPRTLSRALNQLSTLLYFLRPRDVCWAHALRCSGSGAHCNLAPAPWRGGAVAIREYRCRALGRRTGRSGTSCLQPGTVRPAGAVHTPAGIAEPCAPQPGPLPAVAEPSTGSEMSESRSICLAANPHRWRSQAPIGMLFRHGCGFRARFLPGRGSTRRPYPGSLRPADALPIGVGAGGDMDSAYAPKRFGTMTRPVGFKLTTIVTRCQHMLLGQHGGGGDDMLEDCTWECSPPPYLVDKNGEIAIQNQSSIEAPASGQFPCAVRMSSAAYSADVDHGLRPNSLQIRWSRWPWGGLGATNGPRNAAAERRWSLLS